MGQHGRGRRLTQLQTNTSNTSLYGWVGGAGSCLCGLWLTRVPMFLEIGEPPAGLNPAETAEWRLSEQKKKLTVQNTLRVELPPIEEGGVTYVPHSVAASQFANGAAMEPAQRNGVWYQINYIPQGSCDTDDLVAGLAYVRTHKTTKGEQESAADREDAIFELEAAWLIKEPAGDFIKWDAEWKLCHHYDCNIPARKTLVGPQHFVWQIRRGNYASNGTVTANFDTNTLVVWTYNQATPTVYTWTNPERSARVSENSTFSALYFDAHAFPYALWTKLEDEVFPFSEFPDDLGDITRRFRCAKANLGNPPTINEQLCSNWGMRRREVTRPLSSDPPITAAMVHTYVYDVGFYGHVIPDQPTNNSPPNDTQKPFAHPKTYDDQEPLTPNSNYDWGIDYIIGRLVTNTGASAIDKLLTNDYFFGVSSHVHRSNEILSGSEKESGLAVHAPTRGNAARIYPCRTASRYDSRGIGVAGSAIHLQLADETAPTTAVLLGILHALAATQMPAGAMLYAGQKMVCQFSGINTQVPLAPFTVRSGFALFQRASVDMGDDRGEIDDWFSNSHAAVVHPATGDNLWLIPQGVWYAAGDPTPRQGILAYSGQADDLIDYAASNV
jgi:hypothetical protein